MKVNHVFAGIPVRAIDPARAWYEELLGRPPDLFPHDREVAWQLNDGGWIYVVEDAERAGRALVTVLVDDLSAWTDSEPDDSLPGMMRAELTDPDGNRLQIAQPRS